MNKEFIRAQLDSLYDLLKQKAQELQEVVKLTRGQRVVLEQSKEAHFHELVKKKQKVMEEIQVIDHEFMQKYQQLRDLIVTESSIYGAEIQKLQQVIGQITDLMQLIYKEEKQIKELMQKQMKQMHERLRQVQYSPDYVAKIYKKQPPKRP
ncbi:MAG: hypothetical protein GX962_12320 [Epulopiscium sp.]|nr:hypothetical protein [Candidatus Epulonipiscium sp.]